MVQTTQHLMNTELSSTSHVEWSVQTTQHLMNTELSSTSHVEWSYVVNWNLTPSPRQIITWKAQWYNTQIKENENIIQNSIKSKSTKKSKQPRQFLTHPLDLFHLLRLSFNQTPWCALVKKLEGNHVKYGGKHVHAKWKFLFLFGRNKGSN
jgi:hypothetical protein